MSIFYMNGKTFIKDFVKNETPESVLGSQYVLVSNHIRKQGKYEDQVITQLELLPNQRLILDYEDYDEEYEYISGYKEQIERNAIGFLATIIKYAVEDGMTIIMLCSKTEWQYKFFPILKEFVEEKFEYPIYDYKKFKNGKDGPYSFDPDEVIKTCDEILKDLKESQRRKTLSNYQTRMAWIKSLKKKDLKKELKKIGYWDPCMDREEMEETLDLMIED